MKTQFDTEKEAQEALDAAKSESLGWCPLIKDSCHHGRHRLESCVSYYEGTIRHQKPKQFHNVAATKEYWFIQYPGCTNVIISGEITAHCLY